MVSTNFFMVLTVSTVNLQVTCQALIFNQIGYYLSYILPDWSSGKFVEGVVLASDLQSAVHYNVGKTLVIVTLT